MNDSEKPKSWKEHKQSIKHKWAVPFVYFEWKCEQLSKLLEQWAFLDILGHAGRLTILVAVILYFAESGSRRKAKHYQAWQVINAAQGKPGSGGRINALQDLYRDGISLAGVDISKAHLPELNLEYATLYDANLTGAELYNANLAGANLLRANLAGAYLEEANLAGADLRRSNLRDIKNWQYIQSIELANIYEVDNPPDGFIEWAKEHGAVLIKDYKDWKKLVREKRQEKTKKK